MTQNLEIYYAEIRKICPGLSEKEAIEAGDALLQIAKLLSDAVQENTELKELINTPKDGHAPLGYENRPDEYGQA